MELYEFTYGMETDIGAFLAMLREKYPHIPSRKRLCCHEDEITDELIDDCIKHHVTMVEIP